MDSSNDNVAVISRASSSDTDNNLASPADAIMTIGRWDIRPMVLTPGKAEALWEIVSKFKTLFTDFTAGNYEVWATMLTNPDSMWIEICEDQRLACMGVFQGMSASMFDAECHFFALDRMPAEKVDACKAIIPWVFSQYPMLHRITMKPPTMYYAAIRLAEKIGFVPEGIMRETMPIRGRWANQKIMSILRSETCQ